MAIVGSLNPNDVILSVRCDSFGNIYAAGNFTNSASNFYVARFDVTTGVNDLTLNENIIIFPNPTYGFTTILLNMKVDNATMEVTDI